MSRRHRRTTDGCRARREGVVVFIMTVGLVVKVAETLSVFGVVRLAKRFDMRLGVSLGLANGHATPAVAEIRFNVPRMGWQPLAAIVNNAI